MGFGTARVRVGGAGPGEPPPKRKDKKKTFAAGNLPAVKVWSTLAGGLGIRALRLCLSEPNTTGVVQLLPFVRMYHIILLFYCQYQSFTIPSQKIVHLPQKIGRSCGRPPENWFRIRPAEHPSWPAWARSNPGFRPDNTARHPPAWAPHGSCGPGIPAPPRCAAAGGSAYPDPAAS